MNQSILTFFLSLSVLFSSCILEDEKQDTTLNYDNTVDRDVSEDELAEYIESEEKSDSVALIATLVNGPRLITFAKASQLGLRIVRFSSPIGFVLTSGAIVLIQFAVKHEADKIKAKAKTQRYTPPGNCTPKQFEKFKTDKEQACNAPHSCKGNTPAMCSTWRARLAQADRCYNARRRRDNACFEGGDQRHQKEAKQVLKALKTCEKQMTFHDCW